MAILKIARMGHPVLLQRAEPVADPAAPEIKRLVQDMIETMEDASGAGLAAPQVHVPLRLFVFRVPPGRTTPAEGDEEMATTRNAAPSATPPSWPCCPACRSTAGRLPPCVPPLVPTPTCCSPAASPT